MITPAFNLTATERVLPRMALDFTTGVLDPRVTVTRALNTATAINSNGFIAIVNANLPRFDYNPVTLAPKGLLIEEARSNLLTFSEQFDNAAWTKGNTTVTANSTVSPDGTSTADTLTENTSNSQHSIVAASGSRPTITAVNHTHSIYVKANGRTSFSVYNNGTSGAAGAVFNLSTATVTQTGGAQYVASTITNAGNGWYRVTLTFLAIAGTSGLTVYLGNVVAGEVYTGDGVSGVFLYGAQTETGAFATSYIPTTTTSLTRNADNVSMTGTNFSDWYNASEGAFVTQVSLLNVSAGHLLTAFQGYSDVMRVRMLSSIPTANITVGGASQFESTSQGSLGAITTNEIFTSALAYKQNNTSFAAKGVSVPTDATVNLVAAPSRLAIGSLDNVGSGSMTGHMRRVFYYPQRLSNAEIAAFSK